MLLPAQFLYLFIHKILWSGLMLLSFLLPWRHKGWRGPTWRHKNPKATQLISESSTALQMHWSRAKWPLTFFSANCVEIAGGEATSERPMEPLISALLILHSLLVERDGLPQWLVCNTDNQSWCWQQGSACSSGSKKVVAHSGPLKMCLQVAEEQQHQRLVAWNLKTASCTVFFIPFWTLNSGYSGW